MPSAKNYYEIKRSISMKEWNRKLWLDLEAPAVKIKENEQKRITRLSREKTKAWLESEKEKQKTINSKCDFCKRNGYICEHNS